MILIGQVTNQCICPASLAPVKEGAALGVHADPGHLNPGDPDGGLGHVGHPGVVPDHVQQHSVAPLNKAGRTLGPLALEVLIKWVGGSPFTSDNICTLQIHYFKR